MIVTGSIAIRARWALVHDGSATRIVNDRWVLVEGDRVAAITESRPASANTVVDKPHLLVLPGFINLHNHVFTELMIRGRSEDLSSQSYSTSLVYGLLMPLGKLAMEQLSAAEREAIIELGLIQILKSGATMLMEPFRAGLTHEFAAVVERSGLRCILAPYQFSTVNLDLGPDGKPTYHAIGVGAGTDDASSISEWRVLHDRYDGAAGGRIRLALSPHGTDSCGPDLLRMIRKLADEHGCLITTHLSQSPGEADLIRERHGCTPTEYLERMGVLGPDTLVAHCIYASDADLAILARTNTTVLSCPRTFARGGVTASWQRFRSKGIRTVIATDGYNLDIIEEIRAAGLISKIAASDSAVATVGELVAAVTTEAAAAIGRDDIGRLAPGLRADLVAIDLGGSHLRPVSDPLKALVWRASAHDVWATMVDGRLLVNEGRYLAGDEARITEAGASAIEKVWSHPEAQKFLRRAL